MLTQRKAAEMLNVSPQFMSKWINGKGGVSVSTAIRWGRVLKLDFMTILLAPKNRKTREKILGLNRGGEGLKYG